MKCLICKTETEGSRGAAGIKWPNICQPCKNTEDAALSRRLAIQSFVIHSAFHLKSQLNYPRRFETLHDFAAAFEAAIAAHDEALADYLLNNFRIGDHEVLFIGDGSHSDFHSKQGSVLAR